jgi:ABC-type sulfate transport system permease component
MSAVNRRVLPGLGISLGYAAIYLTFLILIPLAACLVKAASLSPSEFLAAAWTPRARAAYALTFGAAFAAAAINIILGAIVAWTLVRYPFPGRRFVDALVDLDAEMEEAAAVLGASRWQAFRRIILPTLIPPALTGFTLAFARGLGEYGSVIFISSNKIFDTEIAPMLILVRLEEYAYAEAAAIATVLLGFSFALLAVINYLEWRSKRYGA